MPMLNDEPGVILLDDRRVFVAANETAAQMLGTSREELIGRRADEFMPVVARALYPLAWQGFIVRGQATGDYAAQLADGSLSHLAYAGFAHRPVRGLHLFVLRPLPGGIDAKALEPRVQTSHIQVGLDLPDDVSQRLVAEADRQERRLPIGKGAERAVLAALFQQPRDALDVMDALRGADASDISVATAAGSTSDGSLTVLAGRVPYAILGQAVEWIHQHGGRIVTNLDESYVWGSRTQASS